VLHQTGAAFRQSDYTLWGRPRQIILSFGIAGDWKAVTAADSYSLARKPVSFEDACWPLVLGLMRPA
jgi:hypothetical protein